MLISDTDNDGFGNPCDSTPNGDTDEDGVENSFDNCPALSNTDQVDTNLNGVGDACEDSTNDEENANSQIREATDTLNAIINNTRGRNRLILSRAAKSLNRALRNNQWISGDMLSERHGYRAFFWGSRALNEIERIADSRLTNATLRAELDAVSSQVLDSLRSVAKRALKLQWQLMVHHAESSRRNTRLHAVINIGIAIGFVDLPTLTVLPGYQLSAISYQSILSNRVDDWCADGLANCQDPFSFPIATR